MHQNKKQQGEDSQEKESGAVCTYTNYVYTYINT